jgi:16S rRNA (guanine527-N7)-methyltransferase
MPGSGQCCAFRPLIQRVIDEICVQTRVEGVWPVPAGSVEALDRLLALVTEWSRRIDLTAARDPSELVDLYVADAAVLATAEPRSPSPSANLRWVDVGTGGGAPGLALALFRPDLDLTLVEPRAKRIAFLRTALGALELPDVRVERARSEALPEAGWQVACSRATLPPPEWLKEGARLATRAVWVLLARAEAPAVVGWRVDRELEYRWPLGGAERRALRYVPREAGQ